MTTGSSAAVRLEPDTVRVLIVDDHELVRAGLASILAHAAPRVRVVAQAGSGRDAIAAVDRYRPDVVLLDYRLPDMNGASVCGEIARRHPGAAVAMLTTYLDDETIHACLLAGARGYLLKDARESDLVASVTQLARGAAVLAPQVVDTLIRWARASRPSTPSSAQLTPLESSILALVADGHSNKVIAGRLKVSMHAVKAVLTGVMAKLGVNTRSEAAAVGVRRGLI